MRNEFIEKVLSAVPGPQRRKPPAILFIGSPLVFGDWILRVAASESGGMEVRRHDELAPAELERLAGEVTLRMVVVEEAQVEELARHMAAQDGHGGGTYWAIAYHDRDIARDVLDRRLDGGPLRDVRLLPMHVPVEVWALIFRLTLWGDFFVPCELLPTAAAESAPGKEKAPAPAAVAAGLTPRETEVLDLVAQGGQNKVIAHRLGLSEHTVKLHIHRIISKVGVRNRTAAANWYLSGRSGAGG